MHNFEYKENARKLLTPEIVNLLSSIYEHKGRQQLFVEAPVIPCLKLQKFRAQNHQIELKAFLRQINDSKS
mgnify:CR=1 FL=1